MVLVALASFSPSRFFSSVEVPIEAREIAAANLKAQAVAFLEDVARRPQVEGDLVGLSRVQECRLLRESR